MVCTCCGFDAMKPSVLVEQQVAHPLNRSPAKPPAMALRLDAYVKNRATIADVVEVEHAQQTNVTTLHKQPEATRGLVA
jgi:hypothetical protein